MSKEYKYYLDTIKPIEKKYNQLCIIYSFFKFKWLKKKIDYYNSLLVLYYKMIKDTPEYLKNLEKEFKKRKK